MKSSSSPQESSSFYEWIFFSWVSPTVASCGQKDAEGKQLLIQDIAPSPSTEDPRQAREDFRKFWDDDKDLMKKLMKKSSSNSTDQETETQKDALYNAFFQFQKRPLIISGIFRFIADACKVAAAFILREFCKYMFDASRETYEGWLWIGGIALCALLGAFCHNLHFFYSQTAFETMRSVLKILVFDKALEYESNHDFVGELTSAHAADTDKVFGELAHWFHFRWSGPLLVIMLIVSAAVIAGAQILLVLPIQLFVMVLQGIMMKKSFARKEVYMQHNDRRIGMLSELLQSIRIIKYQAWEDAFEQSVGKIRALEVEQLGGIRGYMALTMVSAGILTFTLHLMNYALLYEFGLDLKPEVVFPAMTVVGQLSFPLMLMSISFGYYFDAKMAMSRIQNCLVGREKQDYVEKLYDVDQNESANDDIVAELKNVTVLGSRREENSHPQIVDEETEQERERQQEREIVAFNLSLKIHHGQLIIIHGNVGSGKSVLLSALLGETAVDLNSKYDISRKEEDRGFVRHYSPIAYVPQEKYITNATVKENITLVRKDSNSNNQIDEERYQKTIDVCQLGGDLNDLMYGDDTEIGTSGSSVTISGGQSQRVSIARACYSNRELVVLDDALSALDPHVAHNLFEDCILGMLNKKEKKSVVLVTHRADLLSKADRIVLMKDCQIAFDGTLQEYKDAGYLVDNDDHHQQEEIDDQNQNQNEEDLKQDNSTTTADAPPMEKAETETLVVVDNEEENKKEDTAAVEVDVAGGATQLISNEERRTGSIHYSTYVWYFRAGGLTHLFGMCICLIFTFTSYVMFNFTLASWTTKQQQEFFTRLNATELLVSGSSEDSFGVFEGISGDREYLQWMGIFFTVGSCFHLIRCIAVFNFFSNTSLSVHGQLLHRVISAPMSWFETVPIARILNRFSSDMIALDFKLGDQIMYCLPILAVIYGVTVTLALSNPIILAIIPLLVSYFVWSFIRFGKVARQCKRLEGVARSPMMALMSELTSTSGLSSIRVYGMENQLKERHISKVEMTATPIYNMRILERWLTTRTELMSALLIFFIGGLGVLARHLYGSSNDGDENNGVLVLTPGLTCVAVALSIETSAMFSSLTKHWSMMETEMAAGERIKEYSDTIPNEVRMKYNTTDHHEQQHEPFSTTATITEKTQEKEELKEIHHQSIDVDKIMLLNDIPSSTSLPPPAASWPSENPSIEFRNVCMRYRKGLDLVLKNLNFVFKPRSKNALVGKSGSGKSSILGVLDRLVEISSGQVLIDGRDITRDLDVRDLRNRITVIPQDPILFSGTLRSNLDVFNEHTDEELWAVLDKLGLSERFSEETQKNLLATQNSRRLSRRDTPVYREVLMEHHALPAVYLLVGVLGDITLDRLFDSL